MKDKTSDPVNGKAINGFDFGQRMDTCIIEYVKSLTPVDSVNETRYTSEYISACSSATTQSDQLFGNCRIVTKSKVPCTADDVLSEVSTCSRTQLNQLYSAKFFFNSSLCDTANSLITLPESSNGACFSLQSTAKAQTATFFFSGTGFLIIALEFLFTLLRSGKNSFVRSLPWALCLFLIGSAILLFSPIAIVLSRESSCQSFLWLWSVGFSTIQGTLLAKAFRVYQVVRGKIMFVSEPRLSIYVFLFVLLHIVALMFSSLLEKDSLISNQVTVSDTHSIPTYACNMATSSVIAISMIDIFALLFGGYLAIIIKKHSFNRHEGFYLSWALQGSFVLFTVFVLVTFLSDDSSNPVVSKFIVLISLTCCAQLLTLYFPKFIEAIKRTSEEKSSNHGPVLRILNHSIARHYFKAYMRKRVCEESIIFWEQVQEFNELKANQVQEQMLAQKMQQIYDNHLARGSKQEINISFDQQNRISESIKNAINNRTCREFSGFDAIIEEIVTVVEQNDLSRFMKSYYGLTAESLVEFTSFFDSLDGEERRSVIDYFEVRDRQLPGTIEQRSSIASPLVSLEVKRDTVVSMATDNNVMQVPSSIGVVEVSTPASV
jgi:hypothetical protein